MLDAPARLTADLAARAVIAAAVAYGDDPIQALAAEKTIGTRARRSLTPAASAIARSLGLSLARAGGVFGLSGAAVGVARAKGRDTFRKAEASAMRALQYAGWRPEAAETVAATAIADDAPPVVAPRTEVVRSAQGFVPPSAPMLVGALEDRILGLLSEGSANTQGMATVLDAKESAVCSGLRILAHAGKVVADPLPPEGLRAQRWRVSP